MPSAEIITIGTEILLGELVDTNAPTIARALRDLGIDIYRKTSVGDNLGRIAQVIQQALERCEIVITTGGLGPTVDDPTRDAVAFALGVNTEFQPDLWEQIRSRFKRFGRQPTENNRRQAYIPHGAIPVENPVGTAPAFIYERRQKVIISLPGVPREMEYLLEHAIIPYIRNKYPHTGVIKARLLHTSGVGESQIDDVISDLEMLSNPTVGLAAHSGQVDIRIAAKAATETQANTMIQEIETILRERLGDWIYGVDEQTLEQVAIDALRHNDWSLVVLEAGMGGELVRSFDSQNGPLRSSELINQLQPGVSLTEQTERFRSSHNADVALGVALIPGAEKQEIKISLITPKGVQETERPYGGPPELARLWAVNQSLNLLRRL